MEKLPRLRISVSHTTRPRREGEVEGVNYHFTSREHFVRMIEEGRFLEHAEVFGNLYGTSADWVADTLRDGEDVVLEIDWQGAAQIRHLMPEAVSVFILPPCLKTLAQRLRGRASDHDHVIEKRLAGAREEMSHYAEFDYLVVNDNFERALHEMGSIVEANRLVTTRQAVRQAATLADLLSGTETQ
ncbi:Guanylate kinase [Alcanivorax sp. ALC70]|nr:Guanylate kinase [Alcanivorax sp. ALC70]